MDTDQQKTAIFVTAIAAAARMCVNTSLARAADWGPCCKLAKDCDLNHALVYAATAVALRGQISQHAQLAPLSSPSQKKAINSTLTRLRFVPPGNKILLVHGVLAV
jgi:hypothetical protein